MEKQVRKNSNFAEDEGKTFLSCSHFVTKLRIASECQVDQVGGEEYPITQILLSKVSLVCLRRLFDGKYSKCQDQEFI